MEPQFICSHEIDNSNTSFHDSTFVATVNQVKKILGQPQYEENDGSDKVNIEWIGKLEIEGKDPVIFTLYDWKIYRPLTYDKPVKWHIGGHNEKDTNLVRNMLIAKRYKNL